MKAKRIGKKTWMYLGWWWLLLIAEISVANENTIVGLKLVKVATGTQIVIEQSMPMTPKVFALHHPERLVVDFPQTRLAVKLPALSTLNNMGITRIREGRPLNHVFRLVFDFKAPFQYKATFLARSSKINILPKSAEIVRPIKKFIVVIDPGHGGKDPGAIGKSATREKTVVYDIAKKLVQLINQDPHMRAVLTRDGDYYVALSDRLMLARKGKADLFVAIHADSYFNTRANGASVYTLSEHGASSIAARWLARRENYSELGGVDLGDLEDQSVLLRSVLIDMAQTQTSKDSLYLGSTILDALNKVTRLHYPRVERAPFLVLKSPDIPSVLVETGFISNDKEALRLRDQHFQRTIARALFDGIRAYQQHIM